MKQGIIQIYTGDGKGKTTAAIGQAVRARGRGLRVAIFQMLKAPGESGEHKTLAAVRPPIGVYPLGTGGFIIDRKPTADEIAKAEWGWQSVRRTIESGSYDLIVIDEVSHALNQGLLSLDSVLSVLRNKPAGLELVLTGRDMPTAIIDMAELVTEMKMVKHPFEKGTKAREGIEY